MRFPPPDPRRRPNLSMYNSQRFGPPHQIRRQGNPFFSPYRMGGPAQTSRSPYQQSQFSRFGRLPENLDTIMGYAGTITNGVNTLRQIGSLLSLFK